ncbi:LutB/LldF family L-lactate oxidation iron-sulfur protein [Thermodesulfobacteriota bacterium]
MKDLPSSVDFRRNSIDALSDTSTRNALRNATSRFVRLRGEAVSAAPEIEAWRDAASAVRSKVLDNLWEYVDRFARNATKAGAIVHRAGDGQAAVEIIGNILKDRGARKVVKSKSMVSEEVHLNAYLEKEQIQVVETDLGEYIVQLADEPPSHILAPAVHKSRQQVGRLFAERLGVDYSDDPTLLTKIARQALRKEFLSADAGISGVNFAIADTGSITLFTNEGNGRMVTTVPPLHVAILSVEKMLPSFADLVLLMRLLPRCASGQTLSSYFSVITGTRKPGEATGADELHIVLLDNGRSEIVKGRCREILKCIRCAACMNVCPVYVSIGGHAYASTYPGPMGIVLTTLIRGMEESHQLLDASTLCGACEEVCPVRIPLVKLLHNLREERAEKGLTPSLERTAMKAYGTAVESPALFSLGQSGTRLLWGALSPSGKGGALGRLPRPASRPFRKRW